MKKLKILITGGAGYIGSLLTTKLLEQGHFVTVIDKFNHNISSLNHLLINKNLNLIFNDCAHNNILKKYLRNKDYVIPLAALVGADLCEKNKSEATRVNLTGIKKILKIRKKNQKIIFLNTNSGYGLDKKYKIINENCTLAPTSHYGKTKIAAENLISKENNFVIFRLASVFGLSYSFREDLLIHYFVKDAIKIKKLEIYEPNYLRNFIHITDVVKAILFCIDNFEKLKNNIFNLGSTASDITKLKLAKKIKVKLKNKVKIIINNNKKDLDQRNYKVSNKKLEQKGFKPSYLLEDGLNELIQFYKIKYKKT